MLERTQFSYAPDSGRLALVTGAETIAVWALEGDDPSFVLETSRSRLEGVAFVGPNRLLTVHQLGECAVWGLPPVGEVPARSDDVPQKTGEPSETSARTLEGEAAPSEVWTGEITLDVCCFAAKTGARGYARSVAAGGREGGIVLFDLSGDEPTLARAEAHRNNVTRLAFDPHGYRLASGGRDRRVVLWSTDRETFEPRRASEPTESSGTDADDAPASQTTDPLAEYTLRRLNVLEGSHGWPLAIAFSHDETRIATTSLDNGLYLWDPAADEPLLGVVNRHDNWVTELAFSPDDSCLATGSWDTTSHVFETHSLAPRFRFDRHDDFISAVAFVPETDLLVTTGYDGRMCVWNWREGSLVHEIEAHPDWIEGLVVLEGARGLTLSSREVVRLWDLESGELSAEIGDTGVEGFELGREVDFSSYVEVPELSSDELAEAREPVPNFQAVERLEGTGGTTASSPGETAVGLLEDAIDEPESLSMNRLEEGEGGEGPSGTAMLESQIDERTGEAGRGGSVEPSEAADREIPDDPEQVDVAFAEISDADSGDAAERAPDEGSGEEQTGGDEANLLDDEDFQSSIDNVGEAIDKKVNDEEFDVSADLDEPSESASDEPDLSAEPDEADAGDGADSEDPEAALGAGASPTMGSPVADSSEPASPADEAAPGSPEADSTIEGRPEFAPADDDGDEEVDPNSTLAGTPQTHTSEMALDSEESPSSSAAETHTGTGHRLSAPEELSGIGGADPDDLPDPEADGGAENRSLGVDESGSSTEQGKPGLETPIAGNDSVDPEAASPDGADAGSDSESAANASSLADEPTADLEAIDPDGEASEASADERSDDESPAAETDTSSSPAGLKDKLEKLREKKQSGDTHAAAAEGLEVGVPNIWEARPSLPSDRTDTAPLEAADESTASSDFQLRGAFGTDHRRVAGIAPHPHSDLLATCGGDTASVWTFDGQLRLELSVDDELTDLTVTPDGRLLVAGTTGGDVYLWLLPTPLQPPDSAVPYALLEKHEAAVRGLDVDPTGKFLVTGSDDAAARIWSLVDGACMAELKGHTGAVRDASWGQFPVTGGGDGTVRYWDQEGRMINESGGFDAVASVATLGTRTGWATDAGDVYLQTGSQPARLESSGDTARAVAFGVEKTLAVAGEQGQIELFPDGADAPARILECETALASVFMRRNVIGAGGDDGRVYLYSRG